MADATSGTRLATPLMFSISAHGLLVALAFVVQAHRPPAAAQPIRVNLVSAAAAGFPSVGAVNVPKPAANTPVSAAPKPVTKPPKTPPKAAPILTKAPPPKIAKVDPAAKRAVPKPATLPSPVQQIVKQTASTAPPTRAGAMDAGGKGADVKTLTTSGVDFMFPEYTAMITNLIIAKFKEMWPGTVQELSTVVQFTIHRDGSVDNIRTTQASGNSRYNGAAMATIDALKNQKAFEPLPAGYPDDVLTVLFTFDQKVTR